MKTFLKLNHSHDNLDLLAIGGSALCLIHCLGGALLLFIAPSLFSYDGNVLLHALLAVVVFSLAAVALWKGYQHHNRLMPILFGCAGALLILVSFFAVEHHHSHSHIDLHLILTVFGSTLLIVAHVLNLKTCPSCAVK